MGPWSFVEPNFEEVFAEVGMKQKRLFYTGRIASASPATGSNKVHHQEQAALVAAALTGDISK
jgi:2-oxoglutarate dehydrogenase E1 component